MARASSPRRPSPRRARTRVAGRYPKCSGTPVRRDHRPARMMRPPRHESNPAAQGGSHETQLRSDRTGASVGRRRTRTRVTDHHESPVADRREHGGSLLHSQRRHTPHHRADQPPDQLHARLQNGGLQQLQQRQRRGAPAARAHLRAPDEHPRCTTSRSPAPRSSAATRRASGAASRSAPSSRAAARRRSSRTSCASRRRAAHRHLAKEGDHYENVRGSDRRRMPAGSRRQLPRITGPRQPGRLRLPQSEGCRVRPRQLRNPRRPGHLVPDRRRVRQCLFGGGELRCGSGRLHLLDRCLQASRPAPPLRARRTCRTATRFAAA